MRHHKRPFLLLIVGVISFLTLVSLIYFFSPTPNLTFSGTSTNIPISISRLIQIPPLIVFFLLIAIFLFSISTYILKSKAHGILISGFVVIYLLFRLYKLTHPFFLILLLALFFSLEMFVSSRGNSK